MSPLHIEILQIVLGLIVVTTGLKLPWLFVGVMFFVFGMYVEMDLFHMSNRWLIQIIGMGVGVIGIVFGMYLKSVAIVTVSFISGGYGAFYLSQLLRINSIQVHWIFFVIGGILGIILVTTNFNWGVILLSSLGGAALVGKHFHTQQGIDFVVFLSLILLGVLVQAITRSWGYG